MADDSPAGRRRALRRFGYVAGAVILGLDAALIYGEQIDMAIVVTVFAPLLGVVGFDAARSRIELARYRERYGALPTEDDE